MPEPSWHRNQRKQRQHDRGLLSACKQGFAKPSVATAAASHRLTLHHGSSPGQMAAEAKWLCKCCKEPDGKPWANFAFRTHCLKCKVHKGQCFLSKEAAAAPSQRSPGGIAAKQLAQHKQHKKQEDSKAIKQVQKLQKENEVLKKKLAEEAAGSPGPGDAIKEPPYQKQLSELEEQRRFYEKFGKTDELAGVVEQIKALKATKAAAVPEGEQLKRAEQELAKRSKQSSAAEGALAEAKQKVEELEKKKHEADFRKAEAESELERVKKLIVVPAVSPLAEDKRWTTGFLECFKLQPKDILEKYGFNEIVEKMEAMHTELLARQQAELDEAKRKAEASEATHSEGAAKEAERRGAEAGAPAASALGNGSPTSQLPALAAAESAKPAIDDDVLMGLCTGSDVELAKAAKLIMESEIVAKRRKLGSL